MSRSAHVLPFNVILILIQYVSLLYPDLYLICYLGIRPIL